MRTDDIEEPSFLRCVEIERAIDQSIDGLLRMDAEILMQLSHVCRDWEAKGLRLSVSNAIYARRYQCSQSVPRQHLSAEGYQIFVGR